jgi:hypothetical protein
MSNSSNNNNDVAGVRARPEQAREKRRRRPTRDTQRRQQRRQQLQQVLQDMADLRSLDDESLIWGLHAAQIQTRLRSWFLDRDPLIDDARDEFRTAAPKLFRLVLDALCTPEFRRGPLRAQLDVICELRELAVLDNEPGEEALALALALLDYPGAPGSRVVRPAQAAV